MRSVDIPFYLRSRNRAGVRGYIYFIGCARARAVKIGFTQSDPERRVKALQTGCPAELELLAYTPGTIDEEQRLHAAFTPLAMRGEWFYSDAKLPDLIRYISEPCSTEPNSREAFLDGLHDILMQAGGWTPNMDMSEEAYCGSADWAPFRDLLWQHFGPWEE